MSAALMHLSIMTSLLDCGAPTIEVGAIGAERFFGEKRSGVRVGPGATAAADGAVAAVAALAFERVRIAQLREHGRVAPDVAELLTAGVAGGDGQVAARVDLSFVRHEADAGAGQAALCHRRQVLPTGGPAQAGRPG